MPHELSDKDISYLWDFSSPIRLSAPMTSEEKSDIERYFPSVKKAFIDSFGREKLVGAIDRFRLMAKDHQK